MPEAVVNSFVEPPPFDRNADLSSFPICRIGDGNCGGKASGLLSIQEAMNSHFEAGRFGPFSVTIPPFIVIATDFFSRFMEENHLWEVLSEDLSDEALARRFVSSHLPPELTGDLWALIRAQHFPLAVRSSSLLEDAQKHPLAGVYFTKMIPNNQAAAEARFARLMEAMKLVYASTYFRSARRYRKSLGIGDGEEAMAVLLQRIVGHRYSDRFYPEISGVARSYSFYRAGNSRPEDGVVQLALGLGKTIVEGSPCWTFSPARSQAGPPFSSVSQMMRETQTHFWAVDMSHARPHDPCKEDEFLTEAGLPEAEFDGTLKYSASTYDGSSDRLVSSLSFKGPRVLTFAPLLTTRVFPLNDAVRQVVKVCEEALGGAVEIEFAVTFNEKENPPAEFHLLQVRRMEVASEVVSLDAKGQQGFVEFLDSESVLGNGSCDVIQDVVYLRPQTFEFKDSLRAGREVASRNDVLVEEEKPYLLIGFGRWGSTDPWLGVPVGWGDIAGAKVIVEASFPARGVEMSQGSHFFHNIASFGVSYFSMPSTAQLDWDWLESQPAVFETDLLRHVRLQQPLRVRVDGRKGWGIIFRPGDPS